MAVKSSSFSTSSVAKLIRDTNVNLTVEDNINSGAANVQQIFIDNKKNTTTDFYLFMWNLTGSVTFGTTKPHSVLFCPKGESKHYIFPRNMVFGTGICIAGATNFAAAAFTPLAPSSNVAVGIYISA